MRIFSPLLPTMLAFGASEFFGGEFSIVLLMLLGLPLWMDSLIIVLETSGYLFFDAENVDLLLLSGLVILLMLCTLFFYVSSRFYAVFAALDCYCFLLLLC